MLKKLVQLAYFIVPFLILFSTQQIEAAFAGRNSYEAGDTARINRLNEQAQSIVESNPNQSIVYAQLAQTLAERVNYAAGIKNAFICQSAAKLSLGKEREAFQLLNKALTLAIKIKKADEIVDCYIAYGNTFVKINKNLQAEENYRRALAFEEKIGNTGKLEKILGILGKFTIEKGDTETGIEYYKRLAKIQDKEKDWEGLYDTRYTLGNIVLQKNKFVEALNYFFANKKLVENSADFKKIGNALNRIGIVYYNMEKFDEALQEFKKAKKIFEENGIHVEIPKIHLNISNVYLRKKQYDLLRQECEAFMKVEKLCAIPIVKARIIMNFASYYSEVKNYELCLQYYHKAYTIFENIGSIDDMVNAMNNIAICYFNQKDYQQSKRIFYKGLAMAIKNNDLNGQELLYSNLFMADTATSSFAEATKHLQYYESLKGKRLSVEKVNSAMELDSKFEFEKRQFADSINHQHQILLNEKIRKNNEAEMKDKRLKLIVIICVGILLCSILLLLFYKYELSKKQNTIIETQNQEYDILIRELHQRVINNLQVISSIIDLESMRQTDKKAMNTFKDIKPRITSVSLVHSILYSQKKMKGLNAYTYFNVLIDEFKKQHNNEFLWTKYISKVEEIWLTANQLVPMALIITELVTLSHKYAINELKVLEIEIEIKKIGEELVINYSDSNMINYDFAAISLQPNLGYKLVTLLTKQLTGTILQILNGKMGFCIKFKQV